MVVLQAYIKTAALSGIAFFWVNFTVEAFKMARHIIFTSPDVKQSIFTSPEKQRVMCESCYAYFVDDGSELIHGKLLCESCSDDLVRDQLKI